MVVWLGRGQGPRPAFCRLRSHYELARAECVNTGGGGNISGCRESPVLIFGIADDQYDPILTRSMVQATVKVVPSQGASCPSLEEKRNFSLNSTRVLWQPWQLLDRSYHSRDTSSHSQDRTYSHTNAIQPRCGDGSDVQLLQYCRHPQFSIKIASHSSTTVKHSDVSHVQHFQRVFCQRHHTCIGLGQIACKLDTRLNSFYWIYLYLRLRVWIQCLFTQSDEIIISI